MERDLSVVQKRASAIALRVGVKVPKNYPKYEKVNHDMIVIRIAFLNIFDFLRRGIQEIKKEHGIK